MKRISSNPQDYINKKVDLAIFHPQSHQFDTTAPMTMKLLIPNSSGLLVTGIQKLVQQVLILLLQDKESKRIFPDQGCDFLLKARGGYWRSSLDVEQDFNAATVDIRQQLEENYDNDQPDDEILDEISLEGVIFEKDEVKLQIKISSLAGENVTIYAPINLSPTSNIYTSNMEII